jgi:hypothetical protein
MLYGATIANRARTVAPGGPHGGSEEGHWTNIIGSVMRIYVPDMEQMKTGSAPKAEKVK